MSGKMSNQLPEQRSFTSVYVALLLAVALAALDQVIVTTALPTLVRELGSSDLYSWVGSAYLLTAASLAPLYGKMANIFGRKLTVLVALGAFVIGSVLCAMSQTMLQLVLARGFQGIGAGGVMQLVRIITADVTSLQERGKYIGGISAVWGISSSLGGLVGGAIVSNMSWRMIFLLNCPIGALSAYLLANNLNIPIRNEKPFREYLAEFDTTGLLLIVLGSASVLLGLTNASTSMVQASALLPTLLGAMALVYGAWHELHTTKSPIIPPLIFRNPTTVAILGINGLHSMAFLAASYYLPFYFQILGLDPLQAGIRTIPFALGAAVTSTLAGFLLSRFPHYRTIMSCSLFVMAAGFAMMCSLDDTTSVIWQELLIFIPAIGLGPNWTLPLLILQAAMPPEDLATSTAGFGLVRSLLGAAGVTIGSTIYRTLGSIEPLSLRQQVVHEHTASLRVIWMGMTPPVAGACGLSFLIPRDIGRPKQNPMQEEETELLDSDEMGKERRDGR